MTKQLYKFTPDITVPQATNFNTSTSNIDSGLKQLEGYFSINWPDGSPCMLTEMFLLYRSSEVKISKNDGGTVGSNAGHISHLIRYCYDNKKDFWELTTSDIESLICILLVEKNELGNASRNNDTIKTIISTCILFLKWIQNNISTNINLVGLNVPGKRYQIKLITKSFTGINGKKYLADVFNDNLPEAITKPISPISTNIIKELWDTLANLKPNAKVSNQAKSWFNKSQQNDQIEYMNKRRELQLSLLEATGLRPQELTLISASKNIQYLADSKILLPTLKRRSGSRESERLIPIDLAIAMKIEVFIHVHRKKLQERLYKSGIIKNRNDVDDNIYLNPLTGKAVKPDACYQEFSRLAKKAGIEQKVCQSMFRHRFVTNLVKLQLCSFMDNNPLKNRHLITDDDYRTILTKVTKFTGHKSPNSLYHYIDLAWDELGAFSYAYDIKYLHDKLQSIFYSLNTLKSDILCKNPKESNNTLNKISMKIDEIASMAQIKK